MMWYIPRIGKFLDEPIVKIASIILSGAGMIQLILVICSEVVDFDSHQFRQDLLGYRPLGILFGMSVIFLVLFRSAFKDILGLLFRSQRIVAGLGHKKTPFYFSNFLGPMCEEVIVTTQNMRTLLSDHKFLPKIKELLELGTEEVTFILTTFEAMKAIHPPAALHYPDTIVDLCSFVDALNPSERKKLSIHFHPGVSSLSTLICRSKKAKQGRLVFTPKFANDNEPDNRIFCVLDEREHPYLFGRIDGCIGAMKQADSLSLDDMRKIVGV